MCVLYMHYMGVLCMQKLGEGIRWLVLPLFSVSPQNRVSHWTEAGLVTHKLQLSSCVLSSTGIMDVYSSAWLFTWVLRIQSWGLLFVQQALFSAETISYMERCTTTPSLCRARNQTQGFSKLGKHSSSWKKTPAHREDVCKGLKRWVMNMELTSTDQVEMILMVLLLIIGVDSYRRVTLMPTLLYRSLLWHLSNPLYASRRPW